MNISPRVEGVLTQENIIIDCNFLSFFRTRMMKTISVTEIFLTLYHMGYFYIHCS